MKKFIILLILIEVSSDMLFWLLFFTLNLWLFIKSNNEININGNNKHLKLHKWSCILQMFCGVIGIIRSFGILSSISSLALIIQWSLLIIGLTLQILDFKMKGKENHE